MRDSPRVGAPAPVEKLWCTIEDYCESRTGNRRPVRHITRRTGLARSTVSDWFNYRSFPPLEAFTTFLAYIDDETWQRDLMIMWQAAWEAHQAVTSDPRDRHGWARSHAPAGDRLPPGASRRARWRRPLIAVGIGLVVVMAATYFLTRHTGPTTRHDGTATNAGSTAPAIGVVGSTCMVVTARDIRVFTAATGDEPWTTWSQGTRFWVDRDAGSTNRYRTTLRSGRHGWVTTDIRYVQPATGCP